jgi:uncharacterized 2Fe-2S/4Fe-4S cluster protein (DUF4445 family)
LRSPERLAIAFDLGTTTLAASLVDVATGKRLHTVTSLNPQRQFGADILTRLGRGAQSPDSLRELSTLLRSAVADLTGQLLSLAECDPAAITAIAFAGNPAMEHFLLGLNVDSLVAIPFRPLFHALRQFRSSDLGLTFDVPAYAFPLPSGFVGGDLVAFLYGQLESDASESQAGPVLFLDLGTNGEMVLMVGEKRYATSVAAGPAFEAGNLSCGMGAVPGAVDRLRIEGEKVIYSTIGGASPCGICGSGVVETVGAMLRAGILDPTGQILSADRITSNLANRIISMDGQLAFLIYRDARSQVFFTQDDVREFQFAVAAIRAGIGLLLDRSGIRYDDLAGVVLTGSFGHVLDPQALKTVGIFTEKMVHVSSFVHEGALAGVERLLCRDDGPDQVARLAEAIQVVPLSGNPAFEKHFLEYLNFPQ